MCRLPGNDIEIHFIKRKITHEKEKKKIKIIVFKVSHK